MQSTCVDLMGFREETTLEKSQLEEMRVGKLKNGWLQVRMRAQEK